MSFAFLARYFAALDPFFLSECWFIYLGVVVLCGLLVDGRVVGSGWRRVSGDWRPAWSGGSR